MKKVLDRIVELKGNQKTASFARSIGINQQTMDRYLKGREPPIGVIQQLCLVYGVSADWLLGLPERSGNVISHSPGTQVAGRDINNSGGDCSKCKLLQAHIKELTGR